MNDPFTVKWVTESGEVHLWPAKAVSIIPAIDDRLRCVQFDNDEVVQMSIDSGNVFIMNQSGKTVEQVYMVPHPA